MNSGLDEQLELTKAKGAKPKRVEMIPVLLGCFERERLGRGVQSWEKGEAVQGIELVAGVARRIGEGKGESVGKVIL
jgi:hypothetical protein